MQPHNKSKVEILKVVDNIDWTTRQVWYDKLMSEVRPVNGLIKDSPCLLHSSNDGRLSVHSKKVCFGYHLVALWKFGPDKLKEVASNKTSQDCLTISHRCGTRYF